MALAIDITIDTLTLQGLKTAVKPTTIRVTPDIISSLYFPDTSEYYNKYGPRIIKPCINALVVICHCSLGT